MRRATCSGQSAARHRTCPPTRGTCWSARCWPARRKCSSMPDKPPIKHMPIREFVDEGYLQEVNRQFLHPLGLALEVTVASEPTTLVILNDATVEALEMLLANAPDALLPNGQVEQLREQLGKRVRKNVSEVWLSGVWDYRAEPDGIVFNNDNL